MSMSYLEVRPDICFGDILAWTHREWNSWHDIKIQLVRFITQSEYSHVGIAWKIGGRLLVVEAVVPAVRIYPLSKLGDFYHIPLGVEWTQETEEFMLSKVGEPYSQIEAFKALFGGVTDNGKWQCAELVFQILHKAGIYLGNMYTPTAIVREAQLLGAPCNLIKNSKYNE